MKNPAPKHTIRRDERRRKMGGGIVCGLCLLALLPGCASFMAPGVKLDPEVIHKKDLTFCETNTGCFEGSGVVPQRSQYNIELAPRNEDNIDKLVFATCHRAKPFYMEELPKVDLPFFGQFFGKKKRGVKYDYIPDPVLEATGDCDLYIYALDQESEDHAWAVMRTEHPKYQLPATVFCDGDLGKDHKGVSVCEGRIGTTQRIVYPEAVRIGWSAVENPIVGSAEVMCPEPTRLDSGHYEIDVSLGACLYIAETRGGRAHSLLLFGWERFNFKKR